MELTLNDFFCGCGGVGVGFKKAGFTIAGAWDFDKYAVQTYQKNVDEVGRRQDIREMTWSDVPKASVWAFGFPCQDLSVAGKQAGFTLKCNDCGEEIKVTEQTNQDIFQCEHCGSNNLTAQTRSAMFFEMMRLIRETRENEPSRLPKALVAENVKGLKKYIPVLMQELEKNGYIGHIQLYNSKYFDVAQNRERYYIIATRNDLPDRVKMPSRQEDNPVPKLSKFLDAEVDEKYYIPDEKAQTIIRQALERLKKLGKVHEVQTDELHGTVVDDTYGYGEGEDRIYSDVSPTLRASRQGLKVIEEAENSYIEKRLLKFVEEHGYIPKRFNPYNCTDIGELAPTATTQCGSMTTSATVLLIEAQEEDGNKTIVEAVINDRGFVNREPQVSDISPTLRAEAHGNEPKVIEAIEDAAILRPVRNEHGKEIRKQYEAGEVQEKWSEMRDLEPRTDGVSNTLTTVLKDNLLMERKKDDPLHGTVADASMAGREGKCRIYEDTAPTLKARDHKEPRMVIVEDDQEIESEICRETGLLDPEGVGKTLRVGGGVAVKETQLPARPRQSRCRRRRSCRLLCRNRQRNSKISQTHLCACSQETTKATEIKEWSQSWKKERKKI